MAREPKFVCIAIILSIFAVIQGLDPSVVILKSAPVVDAWRGSTFEMRCDVGNRPDGISVRWEKLKSDCQDEQTCSRTQLSVDRIPDDEQKYGLKFEASDTYILIIKNVDITDEGMYYCQLPITKFVKVQDSVRVRVVEKPSIDPMITSSDKFVAVNDDVDLSCGAFGTPAPLIKWTRAGNGMMPGGGFSKLGQTLRIRSITPLFRGNYICTASNDVGEAYRTINIDMQFPPQIDARLRKQKVSQKVGYEIRLTCKIEANPVADVIWTIGNTGIDDERHKVTSYKSAFGSVISKLTIYRVSREELDTEILCTGLNLKGDNACSFTIEAADSPQPVAGQIRSSANQNPAISMTLLVLLQLYTWAQ